MHSLQRVVPAAAILTLLLGIAFAADEVKDLATGEGLMVLQHMDSSKAGEPESENVVFEPRYGYAHAGTSNGEKRVWLLMTDVEAKDVKWKTAKDPSETLRQWCEKEKGAFVLVELDPEGIPELLTQCPANGALAVEMVSTTNGLPSIQTSFEINDGKRLRGSLLGGNGNCGDMQYCEKTKEYYFDVTVTQ